MMTNSAPTSPSIVKDFEQTASQLHDVRLEMAQVIFGQQETIDLVLTAILAGGHALLVGAPGLAKTRLVHNLGLALGLSAKRIQFTPDLMPADILGAEVLDETDKGQRQFRFIQGPVFCQLLMADEINRASPRTQSALLQAMQEHHITVAGQPHILPKPFHVLATQNPIEQEGTYPLPEAQLDRFMFEIDVPYPPREAERHMLHLTTSIEDKQAKPVLNTEALVAAQKLVKMIPVSDQIIERILDIVRYLRPSPEASADVQKNIAWGPSPRAAISLMMGIRARALLQGRFSPSLEDVTALMVPVLKHRMALNFAARAEGETTTTLIERLKQNLI